MPVVSIFLKKQETEFYAGHIQGLCNDLRKIKKIRIAN